MSSPTLDQSDVPDTALGPEQSPNLPPAAGQERGEPDGRKARRTRNREAVLDAVLELFGEGIVEPAAPDVAARSGVSLRSVYRYFDDRSALMLAAIDRSLERARPIFAINDLGQGSLDERIARLTHSRMQMFEVFAPMMRAAMRQGADHPIIKANYERNVAALRSQVADMFAPELADATSPRTVLNALDVVFNVHTYEALRSVQGLDAETAGETIAFMAKAVVRSHRS